MKAVVLWAFLLGVVSCVACDDEFQYAANPTDVKFSLKSYRNQTGHWTAQVQLEHPNVEEYGAAWNVDVDHKYAPRWDGSGSVWILVTITVPPTGNAVPKRQPHKSIPAGYRKFSERHYFSAHTEPATWVDARDICEKEGAYLAVINSEAEARFIVALWPSKFDWASIGFHDIYVEGKHVTIYNQTLREAGYDKWIPGDPNGGTAHNCGFINREALLADGPCNQNNLFFCELEY